MEIIERLPNIFKSSIKLYSVKNLKFKKGVWTLWHTAELFGLVKLLGQSVCKTEPSEWFFYLGKSSTIVPVQQFYEGGQPKQLYNSAYSSNQTCILEFEIVIQKVFLLLYYWPYLIQFGSNANSWEKARFQSSRRKFSSTECLYVTFQEIKLKHIEPLSWDREWAYQLCEALPHGISHSKVQRNKKGEDICNWLETQIRKLN